MQPYNLYMMNMLDPHNGGIGGSRYIRVYA